MPRTITLWAAFGGILWLGLGAAERVGICIEAAGAVAACRRVGDAQTALSLMVIACAVSVPLAYLYLMTRYGMRD